MGPSKAQTSLFSYRTMQDFWKLEAYIAINQSLKRRPKNVFKTDNCLMQVKSIAECSPGAFGNSFDLH